ncbi:MAG: T9SS type A sorting domain-containing protein, partial [Bacteroidetes bacterium]
MKNIIFIRVFILFLLLSNEFILAQWVPCNNGLNDKTIFALINKDSSIFAGTNEGIYHSTDNGDNWVEKNEGLTYPLISEFAIIGDNIIAGTYGGGIFLSTDNGNSWNEKNDSINYYKILTIAIRGTKIFVGTECGDFYISNDTGNSWISKRTGQYYYPYLNSIAISGNYIYIGTGTGGVILSTDDGDSWSIKNNGLTNYWINSISINKDSIYAGTNSGVFLSTDSASSWTAKNSGLTDSIVNCLVIYGSNIFAGTYTGGIFLSTDSGNSWTAKNDSLTGLFILSLAISGDYIFAGTDGGGVFRARLSDFGINGIENTKKDEIAFNISPNPFSSSFNIEFTNNKSSNVLIDLYDILGNRIYTKNLGFLESGMQTTTINLKEDINPGCYLVVVRSGADIQSIKVVKS